MRLQSKTTLAVAALAAAALTAGACSSPASDSPSASTSGSTSDATGAASEISRLEFIVPAAPGGGWDQTGRALEADAKASGVVGSATVTNVEGAGGRPGLASLLNQTDPNTLMVMGYVMLGSQLTNGWDQTLNDTKPIARLTEEAEIIVVPKDSPYNSLKDLVDAIIADGREVSVGGGSAGGIDQILAGQLLLESGQTPDEITEKLNYVPYSGGGEATTALLGNQVSAGISGVSEWVAQIENGDLKPLAVSSAERSTLLPDVPTIQEEGIDIELTNWRGVVANGSITADEEASLVAAIKEVTESSQWKSTLETKGWADAYLGGAEFGTFLEEQEGLTKTALEAIGLL